MNQESEIEEVEIPSSGLYYVIPAAIMNLPNSTLSPLEKLLYCLLSGLAHENGECFPGDKYLADRLGVKTRQHVNEMVSNLESLGLITKRVESHPKNSFRRRRIITIVDFFKKSLRSRPQTTLENSPQTTLRSRPQATLVSEDIVSKEESREESALARAKEAAPKATLPPPLVFEKVKIEKEHYESLIKDYGEEIIGKYIQKLVEYSKIKPKKFKEYERHDMVIRQWASRDGIQKISQDKKKDDTVEWLKKTLDDEMFNEGKVVVGKGYVDFIGQYEGYIKLEDPKFKEKVEHFARKIRSARNVYDAVKNTFTRMAR